MENEENKETLEKEEKKSMKHIILIIIIAILVIAAIALICIYNSKKKEITFNINYMHFHYSAGTSMNASVTYDLTCDKECKVKIKPSGIPNEEILETKVDEKTIKQIEEIFQKYEVDKWDGFNKYDKYVLDGNDFSITIKMKNDDTISASGYMKWPKNYGNVKTELDKIFNKIYKEKSS